MKKWLLIAGAGLAVVFVAVLSIWLWLMHTESGARFALARADGALERLEYGDLSGALSSNLVIDGFRLEQASARVEADRVELAVRVELFNGPRVLIRHLRGTGIDVHLPQGEPAESTEPAAPFDLGNLVLPVVIDVEELDLRDLALHSGGAPTLIERIELAGRYAERIEIERLAVKMKELSAQARGEWALETRGSGRLDIEADVAVAEDTRQSVALSLSGRIDALDFEATSQGPARVEARGRVRGLPGSPSLETELTGTVAGWPGLPVDILDAELSVTGEPDAWQAQSRARVIGPDIPEGRWSVALSGDTQSMQIETLEADVLGGRVTGSGSLDWRESAPRSTASVRIESIDLTPLYPQWPNQGRLSGAIDASTEGGVIEVEQLALSADPGDLQVSGSGRIDPAADELDVRLQWQAFAWPPVTDERTPLVSSESGTVRLEGRISDWRAEVEAMLESPQAPAARIELEASGSRERATVQRLFIDAGEHGRIELDGDIQWAPALGARLAVNVDAFDPGVFVPQLPGRINGRALVDLDWSERRRIEVTLEDLGGRLREQSLAGGGTFSVLDNQPESADLDLRLGDNRVAVSTPAQSEWEIALDAVSLSQLWPSLEGRVTLDGRVAPDAGRVELTGELAALRYEEYAVEQADLNLDLNWLESPGVTLAVNARNFDIRPWDRLDRLDLTLDGGCDSHRLSLEANGGRGRIALEAAGTVRDCLDSENRSWQGEISRLTMDETLAGDWRLDSALPIEASASAIRGGAACLTEANSDQAQLCLEALEIGEQNRVVTRLAQVPMDLLLLPIDPVFSLTTPLSGRIEAGWDAAGLSRIDGQLRLGAGVLKPIGEDRELLAIDSVRLDLRPGDTTDLRADLNARLEGRSEIRGRATVADLRNLADTRLDGEAQLELPDIAAFAHLIPRVDRIGGSASGRVNLSGPVSAPAISGRLSIQDGQLVHAPLGLDIQAIELALSGSADEAELTGSARSGDGTLEIDGSGRLLDAGWTFQSTIAGREFAFAQADWLQLTASPEITLSGQPDQVRIDGDIRVDRLRAGLPPGSAERVQPSDDVEVIGESDPDASDEAAATRRVVGRLGLDLGDDAKLATTGLETTLAGGLELLWNGPPRPQGRGTILLPEGSYRAYGQNLEINGGEVIFNGQAVDNPRLDIRAVREIFGDPKVEAAGVHIAGSARQPQIDLYTDPPTSEDRALAYVITGSDFDHAGGQGALSVGVYLLPRLFVSYGVGLFETGNVLSGRYEFSRHWGVRVVSGERDTGVDLSYTVNN